MFIFFRFLDKSPCDSLVFFYLPAELEEFSAESNGQDPQTTMGK